jgi:hypothetical protein
VEQVARLPQRLERLVGAGNGGRVEAEQEAGDRDGDGPVRDFSVHAACTRMPR